MQPPVIQSLPPERIHGLLHLPVHLPAIASIKGILQDMHTTVWLQQVCSSNPPSLFQQPTSLVFILRDRVEAEPKQAK